MTPSAILEAAADLIAPEGAWTQGEFAYDFGEEPVDVRDESATCWCALGALGKVADRDPNMPADYPDVGYLRKAIGRNYGAIALWNDDPDRTQDEVVIALRKAAKLAREDGQ